MPQAAAAAAGLPDDVRRVIDFNEVIALLSCAEGILAVLSDAVLSSLHANGVCRVKRCGFPLFNVQPSCLAACGIQYAVPVHSSSEPGGVTYEPS
jgi:hypothetical protein